MIVSLESAPSVSSSDSLICDITHPDPLGDSSNENSTVTNSHGKVGVIAATYVAVVGHSDISGCGGTKIGLLRLGGRKMSDVAGVLVGEGVLIGSGVGVTRISPAEMGAEIDGFFRPGTVNVYDSFSEVKLSPL